MGQAIDYLRCMFTNLDFGDKALCLWVVYGAMLLFVEWFQREKQHALQFPDLKLFSYRPVRWGIYILLLLMIDKYIVTSQTFIYFQF
jgi:hypothetical protein